MPSWLTRLQLQLAGIDLNSPAPIRAAVAYVGSLVDALERAFAA